LHGNRFGELCIVEVQKRFASRNYRFFERVGAGGNSYAVNGEGNGIAVFVVHVLP